MSALVQLPVAAGETWLAVFGGLIPIIGIGAIGWIVVRASKNDDDDEADGEH
jgi:hypothetical protein